MTFFSKKLEAFIADVNMENSETIYFFERITKFIFTGVVSLAIPIFLFLLF